MDILRRCCPVCEEVDRFIATEHVTRSADGRLVRTWVVECTSCRELVLDAWESREVEDEVDWLANATRAGAAAAN